MADLPLNVVLVDDEPLGRVRLRGLLAQLSGSAQVTQEWGESVSALLWLQAQDEQDRSPDVLLLDIQMPGLDGLVLAARLRALKQAPAVIFVTARPEHAVKAFDVAAVDYLTKPVRLERLQTALDRARSWLKQHRVKPDAGRADKDEDVLIVQERDRIERLPFLDVLYFKADQKQVFAHTADRCVGLDQSLVDLESRFGARVLRIHRNTLVVQSAVQLLARRASDGDDGDAWSVQIQATGEWLSVSRRQLPGVKEKMTAHAVHAPSSSD